MPDLRDSPHIDGNADSASSKGTLTFSDAAYLQKLDELKLVKPALRRAPSFDDLATVWKLPVEHTEEVRALAA
jgi:hypothetical protein